MLLLTVGYKQYQVRATTIVHAVLFKRGLNYLGAEFLSETHEEHMFADCSYVSDTSVTMKVNTENYNGSLYGIRL